jgi:ATP-dependent protease Clp ATPase subunit
VHLFEERFFKEHQLQLHFDAEAMDEILKRALKRDTPALSICQELASDFEYALKLLRDRTSQDSFLITPEALDDLDGYLNRLIRDSYQKTLFRE